jgi:two-component system chemotaxis sensor kinase CheA
VGLDVVRTGLDRLGGTIAVTTEKDVGTTFALSLPLTFSLMDVLHVHMDRQSYLIPLQCIVGTEKFQPDSVRLLGQDEALYRFREAYVPLVDLSRTFAHKHGFQRNARPILVFLHTGARTLGVPVDELLEPQQIVIKSLETNFRSVTGFAGAAMLGDGSVALVLDPLGLEQLCFEPVIRN